MSQKSPTANGQRLRKLLLKFKTFAQIFSVEKSKAQWKQANGAQGSRYLIIIACNIRRHIKHLGLCLPYSAQ